MLECRHVPVAGSDTNVKGKKRQYRRSQALTEVGKYDVTLLYLVESIIGMDWNPLFFFNSVLLGAGLAMDAFSVSLANGLNEPAMKAARMSIIAGVYAVFQFMMPVIGWIFVHTLVGMFKSFQVFVPWIALILLCYIGGRMLWLGIKGEEDTADIKVLGAGTLLAQGVATSIDALSVGFTIAGYRIQMALAAASIIAVVTYVICMAGLSIGKRIGTRFSAKATMIGGMILIAIGIEIFVTGIVK